MVHPAVKRASLQVQLHSMDLASRQQTSSNSSVMTSVPPSPALVARAAAASPAPSMTSTATATNGDYSEQIRQIDEQMRLMQEIYSRRQAPRAPPSASSFVTETTATESEQQVGGAVLLDHHDHSDNVLGAGSPSPVLGDAAAAAMVDDTIPAEATKAGGLSRGFKALLSFGTRSMKKAYLAQIDSEIASLNQEMKRLKMNKKKGSNNNSGKTSNNVNGSKSMPDTRQLTELIKGTSGIVEKDEKVRPRPQSPSWKLFSKSSSSNGNNSNTRGKSPLRKKARNQSPQRC